MQPRITMSAPCRLVLQLRTYRCNEADDATGQSTKSLRSSPLRGARAERPWPVERKPIAGGEPRPENRGVVNLTQDGASHERD